MTIRLQQRDLQILSDLGRYGLLDGKVLADRHFGGGDRVPRRRLARLVAENLLQRFSVSEYFYANGRQPYVYALAKRGAEVLLERSPESQPRVIDSVSAQFVAHTLQVSQFLLRLEESAEAIGITTSQWCLEFDVTDSFRINPDPRTAYQSRYILHETFAAPKGKSHAKPYSYRPDAAFCLSYCGHALLGYLEVDRSTEPLRVFGRKLPAFSRMVSEQRYRGHWPSLNGQPVTVRCYVTTRSRRRLKSIAGYLQSRGEAAALRLACADDLKHNLLTDCIWSTVDAPDEKGAVING